ncbi:hypothetical protein [Limnoglobus roseus]|uniref:Uncharacterized protein n=1 Tax=Limnoglobus roseus TaxID=2598579 RepID=A0A5C1A9A1_9BACT|nr:hypothetical protein [Limnoglobus roseus]QEL14626.1 hypothetical protein PX52LOC_01518 [Limnoglobus roseus]
MKDLAAAKAKFLSRVEKMEAGESARFVALLDALIAWSEKNGLTYMPTTGQSDALKFSLPGSKLAFWTATPRKTDGGKLTILADTKFPDPLRAIVRDELIQIEGRPPARPSWEPAPPEKPPEIAFIKLIWGPHRDRVIDLMGRLLVALKNPESSPQAPTPAPPPVEP